MTMGNSISAKEHEDMLVDIFIIKEQRYRFNNLLNSKKGRIKARKMLPHKIKFKSNCIKKIPPKKQESYYIYEALIKYKAPKYCYLISENTEFDGKTMILKEAIHKIIGSTFATIISCIPGQLAYYEGEDINHRLILKSV